MDFLHGLPPLKRLRILQEQEQNRQKEDQSLDSCSLPAKKRKESRDSSLLLIPDASPYCLPTKKRVRAFHPDFAPESLDLNVEYKPPLEEESISKSELEGQKKEEEDKEKEKEKEVSDVEMEIQEIETVQDEEEDDGILCAICQSTDGDPSDPIVFCDGCDLMVHASCYGNPLVKSIPEGDWFCSQCLASSSSETGKKVTETPFSCCLCPLKGGAMKPTNDGQWAHIVCGLYVPEVFFEDPEGREGIDCSKILKRRWKTKCYICRTSRGCSIDCSEPKCSLAFHVTCGLEEDLCIEYQEGRRSGAIVAGFCRNHTDLWKKQQLTGKFKIVARDEGKL
ncbi:protein Jade-1 [Cucumis melo var. makuwa]|uniref:Protein Jade-1 n=2 Tax=Cucumis melo TaxID=3656 RepID=A0A5D3DWL7_CUCMM|nr:protein Jade-1 [Cucumis melo var. makuwa]TYK27849.1 protein Jade-1 [Cucumis melo var. makuwa]